MRALLWCSASIALLCACDPDPEPIDAGDPPDTGVDAATDSGAPPMCMPECADGRTCCEGFTEADACFDLRNDPEHCGNCAVDCVRSDRGDACANSQCSCGTDELGCLGNTESFCCPPRTSGGRAYCANLNQSPADCGGCNAGCDPRRADRCDGGRCQCGPARGQCDGTPESTCCTEGVDVECADLTTSRFHCGACNILCQGAERCEAGACTRGDSCEETCALGEVCCDGACCARRDCISNACVERSDAGASADAGSEPIDAGSEPIDAGSEPIDAGSGA